MMTAYFGDEGSIFYYVEADDPVVALGAPANPNLEEIARTDHGILFRGRMSVRLDSQGRTIRRNWSIAGRT